MHARFRLAILVAMACAFALTLRPVDHASAHAFLDHSDPAANAIVSTAPDEVQLWFTERLEPKSTKASLVDHLGNTIPGTSYRIGDAKELIVTLPGGLGNGTYSIVWQNISADDGHPATGYLPFTIGSAADIQQITIPVAASTTAGAPEWLRAGSRWLAFIGLFLAASLWPIWSLVLQPAMRRTPGALRAVGPVLPRLTVAVFAIAVIGNLAALLVQAAEPSGSYGSALRTTLFSTRYGDLWLARIIGLAALAVLLTFATWARPWRRRWIGLAALAVSAALAVPFSLNAHANAQTTGRAFAITADVAHLVAASFWGGGAVLLLAILWSVRSRLPEGGLRRLLVIAIPRFSFLALAAWVMLAVSGGYAAWLEVANVDGALDTTYGNAFLIKMAIAVVLLGFGATHLLVVTRKLQSAANGERWSRRFLITLSAEVVAIAAILLVTGWLTSEPPAREVLEQESASVTIDLSANGIDGSLIVTPGTAGPNHIRLQLNNASGVPSDADGLLRLTAADSSFGTQEITLTPVGGNAWETHGSQFSLVGDWSVTAIVRKIGEFQWQATADVPIKQATTGSAGPSEPWHFNTSALSGLLLLFIGAICVGWAVTAGRNNSRKEASGIASAALVVGLLLVIQGRIDAPAAIDNTLADSETLARGEAIYSAQCLACHGVDGKGDGPAAVNMPVQPANFTDPSHLIHSESTMESYVRNGFPNSGMPPFQGVLSDQQISDVVAYIRAFAINSSATIQVPAASECTVARRDPQSLMQSTPPAQTLSTIDLGPEPIDWPQGNPASSDDVTAITNTVRQFIACSNADDYGRVLALSTANYLEPQFANLDAGARQAAIDRAHAAGTPVAQSAQLGIEKIENVETLDDGRIGAEVTTVDPINHPHVTTVVLIFAQEDGGWKIDEVRSLVSTATPGAGTPAVTSWPLTATVSGYQLQLIVSPGPDDARPVRVTLRDSDGKAINDAQIAVYFTPRAVGVPSNVTLTNSDPATYTGKTALPESGTIDASVEITLADGTQLENVFSFAQ
jgi:copper transport protein